MFFCEKGSLLINGHIPGDLVYLTSFLHFPINFTELRPGCRDSGDDTSNWQDAWHANLNVIARSRDASPFGKSRHNTPSITKRRISSETQTPSPLDHGYQTLEHSYDGESSLSSDTVMSREISSTRGQAYTCQFLSLNDVLMTRVLSHLHDSRDIINIGATCSRLRKLAWQPCLWSRVSFTDNHMLATDVAMRSLLARLVWTNGGHGATCVTRIKLSGCSRTGDRSLALIARNCPHLEKLELQRCRNVTNGGILDLVSRCNTLNYLDLTGTLNIIDEKSKNVFCGVGIYKVLNSDKGIILAGLKKEIVLKRSNCTIRNYIRRGARCSNLDLKLILIDIFCYISKRIPHSTEISSH